MIWIVSTDTAIAELLRAAQASTSAGDAGATPNATTEIRAVIVTHDDAEAPQIPGVDSVTWIQTPTNTPLEALAPQVAATVEAQAGDVVIVANGSVEKAYAGAIAAATGAPIFSGARAWKDSTVEATRFGGISLETIQVDSAPVVIVLDSGTEVDATTPAPEPVAPNATATAQPAVITGETTDDSPRINLRAAKTIVAVGRGFTSREDLQLARDLADAIGAELACTRPLAEGSDWMPKDTYIGVSGQVVAPELYIAVGISGQLQHTVGATGSGTIVVINNEESSPYFREADYGIVADLYQVLPALTEALTK